jgi:hypothetical protein
MQRITIFVPSPADVLNASSFGAGALVRWESASTVAGSYTERGTVAVVSGTTEYVVWDAVGTSVTWYRTRFSDAAAHLFSDYSAPFQGRDAYLSVDQFRAFNPAPSSTDEDLQILLNGAAEAIVQAIGPAGALTERLRPHGDLLMLSRPPQWVAAVLEDMNRTAVALDPSDYALEGQTLRRLASGPNPRRDWRGRVAVTYTPLDDTAERQRVQRELVELELNSSPGLLSQQLDSWREMYEGRGGAGKTYAQTRADILASTWSDDFWVH